MYIVLKRRLRRVQRNNKTLQTSVRFHAHFYTSKLLFLRETRKELAFLWMWNSEGPDLTMFFYFRCYTAHRAQRGYTRIWKVISSSSSVHAGVELGLKKGATDITKQSLTKPRYEQNISKNKYSENSVYYFQTNCSISLVSEKNSYFTQSLAFIVFPYPSLFSTTRKPE
jgi:hypothetical protein